MRGDQLARQWRVIRAIEARPNGVTVVEIAKQKETGIRTFYRDLEAGFAVHTEKVDLASRRPFIDKSKFKIPLPFTASHPISHYFCRGLVWVLRRIFSNDSIHSLLEKIQYSLFTPDPVQPGPDSIRLPFRDKALQRLGAIQGQWV